MGREFITPGQIYTGWDALDFAGEKLCGLGKKALIVTDEVMIQLGNVAYVEEILNRYQVPFTVFSEINGEPTDTMIHSGVQKYKEEQCDFLIALGGGSPIDSMKAIGAIASGGGSISDYMGKVITAQIPPMAAIPTTAGTGSEATQFTIITDTEKDIKMLLKGAVLMPDIAIVDPIFSMTAPQKITAATGLDALTHAIEAFTSQKAQALSDTFALSAVKRILRYLPIAYQDGSNKEAREQMAIASLEAGIAFNNASVTIVHGMSRPIGALFHVPHGLSNAMLLKECLSFVLDGAYAQFAELGRAVEAAQVGADDQSASRAFMDAVVAICEELEVPSLKEYGIVQEEFERVVDKMAADAMESGSPQNTRKSVSLEDVKQIYRNLWA